MEKIIVVLSILVVIACLGYLGTTSHADSDYPIDKEVKLYYFGVDNCYFCTLQKPLVMQLKANGFNFEIINATHPTPRIQVLLDKYAVTKYPTIIIAKPDGSSIRIEGFRPLRVLREALR